MGSAKWLNTFQTASHRSIHQRCPQGTVLSSFSKPVRTSTVMLLWACGWRSTLICIEERATYFSAHQTSKTTRLKSQNMASRYTYGCNNITSWYMYIYIYINCTWISFKDFRQKTQSSIVSLQNSFRFDTSHLAVGITLRIFEGISKGLKIAFDQLQWGMHCYKRVYIYILRKFIYKYYSKWIKW